MSDKAISLFQSTLGLVRPFRLHIALSALLGVCGGLSITALLATINTALNTEGGPDLHLALLFGGLCLLGVLCSTCSKLLTNYVGQRVVATLRQDLAARILVAPIEQIERYRIHRMIPVLLSDVATLSAFALTVAPMLIAFTVTLSCLTYLALLSWPILLITLATVIIGTGAQYMAHSYGMRSLLDARDGEDDLQKHYQAITQGAKELRIQKERRLHIQDQEIRGTTLRICQANIRAATIFLSAETFGSMLFFAVIGIAIAFQVFWPSADKTVLSGFVLVMLYMKAPLEQLVTNVPGLSRAKVAFRRIHEMSERFSSAEPQLLSQTSTAPAEPLTAIELHQLTYTYPGNGFNLGPIDLTIRQGEITFIVGENGCGKTTLIKLLLGLYSPSQGEVLWNGQPVRDLQRDAYRQLFATVFTDYYLFDQLLQGDAALPEEALKYLERLDIAHKVNIREGQFSTTDLSTGQRKRLALVNAWLDNRPVLVFDEWAADQDPAFRRIFYTELLPELKRQGKTIVVISHDDRYFDVADQLVHLHAGQVVDEPENALA